jgi:hypothetical protein
VLDRCSHVIHDLREVDGDPRDADAEPIRCACAGSDARRSQERLGRDAAGPQTVAPGALAFHKEDPGTEPRGGLRTDDPGRPAPDDQKVPGLILRGG